MGLIFAIIAPAFFSISNFFDRFIAAKQIKNPGVLTVFGALASLITGLAVLIIIGFPMFPANQMALILLAGILVGAGLLPYYAAMSIDDASRVVPYFQMIPVMVLLLSYIFLHESLTRQQLVGFAVIVSGAFLLSLKKLDGKIFRLTKSMRYMALASLCIAASIVIFKFVVIHQTFWPSLGYDFLGEGMGGALLLLMPGYRKGSLKFFEHFRTKIWITMAWDQGFYTLGRFFSFQALALIPAALVASLNGLLPFYTLAFGIVLSVWFPSVIKEDIRRHTILMKLAAMLLLAFGVWLVYA